MVDDISSIIRSCAEMEKPMTFSIEGEWGKGKTWIVEKIADTLDGIDVSSGEKCKSLESIRKDGIYYEKRDHSSACCCLGGIDRL